MLERYTVPLVLMLLHALLSALWNVAGVWLLAHGERPLGPTASLSVVGVLVLMMLAYGLSYAKGYQKTFFFLVTLGALSGVFAIYGALTKDVTLWPSEFWRYSGIIINSIAVVGFVWTLFTQLFNVQRGSVDKKR